MSSAQDAHEAQSQQSLQTKILPIDATKLGTFTDHTPSDSSSLPLEDWTLELNSSPDADRLRDAADALRTSAIPVAFPTETVYGLGADATRSDAVKGIYAAKQRPSDNPLIVHISSIKQLRSLYPSSTTDPIPKIYHSLIRRFWPGPLTIILPVPSPSPLAKEVTSTLPTFGARMPRNLLALALIKTADRPIAAPSANASTKPSPTAAEHVLHDLQGRIETILDSGPCDVGVESTVVDGLCSPPAVLRPGGISIAQIRQIRGWEGVVKAYADTSAKGGGVPRAPGMKYRHYSPRARVVLFEAWAAAPAVGDLAAEGKRVGLVRTRTWRMLQTRKVEKHQEGGESKAGRRVYGSLDRKTDRSAAESSHGPLTKNTRGMSPLDVLLKETNTVTKQPMHHLTIPGDDWGMGGVQIWDVKLGPDTASIARGLFSTLRELDRKDVDVIYVEGIDDSKEGDDVAAAVMNRLRKAAEVRVS
ncbi:hypothetical protein MBLNU457_2293t1 [Dothideomycetes sp. NU457]